MKTMLLVVAVLGMTVGLCGVGQAAGIPIAGADVGPAYWLPIDGEDAILAPLQLTLKPFSTEGPDTPTNVNEILPWAVANFGVDLPFEGNTETFLRPLGIGVSESIKVGTIATVDLRAGIGYLGGTGRCVFLKSGLFEF